MPRRGNGLVCLASLLHTRKVPVAPADCKSVRWHDIRCSRGRGRGGACANIHSGGACISSTSRARRELNSHVPRDSHPRWVHQHSTVHWVLIYLGHMGRELSPSLLYGHPIHSC
eukprot:XP_001705057.1 Hypothetical protein GL50803_39528 [Giardia lamblia ATCC 50803]